MKQEYVVSVLRTEAERQAADDLVSQILQLL